GIRTLPATPAGQWRGTHPPAPDRQRHLAGAPPATGGPAPRAEGTGPRAGASADRGTGRAVSARGPVPRAERQPQLARRRADQTARLLHPAGRAPRPRLL